MICVHDVRMYLSRGPRRLPPVSGPSPVQEYNKNLHDSYLAQGLKCSTAIKNALS